MITMTIGEKIKARRTNRNISEHTHHDLSNCDLIGRKEMLQKCSISFFMLPGTFFV